jgi:hypothetical protein
LVEEDNLGGELNGYCGHNVIGRFVTGEGVDDISLPSGSVPDQDN